MGDDLNADQRQDLFRLCMFLEGENKKLKERESAWHRLFLLQSYALHEMGHACDRTEIRVTSVLDLGKTFAEIEKTREKVGYTKELWVSAMVDLVENDQTLQWGKSVKDGDEFLYRTNQGFSKDKQ